MSNNPLDFVSGIIRQYSPRHRRRARVGYEVKDSQRGAKRRVGYNHLISNKREWNNCFIKNHQQILLDFADFACLEQPEGNLMDAISRVWYNGSYTIAAKPIKTLELHYTMIQYLKNIYIYGLETVVSVLFSNTRTRLLYNE